MEAGFDGLYMSEWKRKEEGKVTRGSKEEQGGHVGAGMVAK